MICPRRFALVPAFVVTMATALAILLAAPATVQAKQIKEPATGVGFDVFRKWGPHKMRCVGTCLRKKMMFKVYAGCFYVDVVEGKKELLAFLATPEASGAYQDGKLNKNVLLKNKAFYNWLIKSDFAKSIDMTFVRDVDAEKIRETYKEGLANFMKDKKTMMKFVNLTKGEIKEWEHLTLNIFPGGKVVFQFAGKTNPPIISKDLAQGLLSIYFDNNKAISQEIQRGLVKNIHTLLK